MYEQIEVSRLSDFITKVILNRPRQLNALSGQMIHELTSAVQEFEDSDDRVLLITGAGRAFCFGADFLEFQNPAHLPGMLRSFQNLIRVLYECSGITIGVLNGFATGAGLDLALACDFRVAVETAKLGEAYISMGLVPDGGGSFFLPNLIGRANALEMLLTGEAVSADRALSLGIVQRVFPAENLETGSLEFAAKFCHKSANALRLTKKLVRENRSSGLIEALEREREAQISCFLDPDHQKLLQDFLSKRKK